MRAAEWPALLQVGQVLDRRGLVAYVWGSSAVSVDRYLAVGVRADIPGCGYEDDAAAGDVLPFIRVAVRDPAALAAWVGEVRDAFVLGDMP